MSVLASPTTSTNPPPSRIAKMAWNIQPNAKPTSIREVMDEQICQNLAEEGVAGSANPNKDFALLDKMEAERQNMIVAMRLQAQFDSGEFEDIAEGAMSTSLDFVDATPQHVDGPGTGAAGAGGDAKNPQPPDVDADFALALRLQEEEDLRGGGHAVPQNTSESSESTSCYQQFNEHGSSQANNEYTSQKLGPKMGYRHLKADVDGDNTFNVENIDKDAIMVEDGRYIHWDGHNHRDQDNMIVTKHDARISATQRINRLNDLYGDAVGDLQKGTNISPQAYNSIKEQLRRDTKKGVRAHAGMMEAEKRATHQRVLDQKTQRLLLKVINTGCVDQLHGILKSGKEANVYHAIGNADFIQRSKDTADGEGQDTYHKSSRQNLAVKIFKTTLSDFKNRVDYVEGDPRYAKVEAKKINDVKLIKLWAEKEWRNLTRIYQAGILCPKPLMLKSHVLVMSFIGSDNGHPAPQLGQVAPRLSDSALRGCYMDVVIAMRQLYQKCNLVHADLSESNLLYRQEESKTYIIDVGQAVDKAHPNADQYLARDAFHLTRFFSRRGISNVLPWQVLCQFVVEMDTVLTYEGTETELEREHALLKIIQKNMREGCEKSGCSSNVPKKLDGIDEWREFGCSFRDAIVELRGKLCVGDDDASSIGHDGNGTEAVETEMSQTSSGLSEGEIIGRAGEEGDAGRSQ